MKQKKNKCEGCYCYNCSHTEYSVMTGERQLCRGECVFCSGGSEWHQDCKYHAEVK